MHVSDMLLQQLLCVQLCSTLVVLFLVSCYLAITRCKETRKQVAIISSGRSEAPNTAAPVYEDIVPTPGREQAGIELQENVAYGPVNK